MKQFTDVAKITGDNPFLVASFYKLRPANDVSFAIKPTLKADNRRKVSSDAFKSDKMSSTAGSKYRALVIEDSLVVRKALTRVLVKIGFQVTSYKWHGWIKGTYGINVPLSALCFSHADNGRT
jgi:hypothetical protein